MMHLLQYAALFLLMIFNQSSFSANTQDKVQEKILVLGDSLSAGYGIQQEQAWVQLLQQRLQVNYAVQMINASVSGETSSGGKARLSALLLEHKPTILIVELGGNDGLRGQPLNLLEANLQAMIDEGRKSGAQVLLVGMQIPGNYGARYTREFQEIYPRIASKSGISFVPFLLENIAIKPELMQADRIHPNAAAQKSIMNNVLPVLLPMIKTKRSLAASRVA